MLTSANRLLLKAIVDVATYKGHEDILLLQGAESFLEDVVITPKERFMLETARKTIEALLSEPKP